MTDVLAELRLEIARVGWSETARRSGVERASLHRALGDGKANLRPQSTQRRRKPHFVTVLCVAEALGFELKLVRAEQRR